MCSTELTPPKVYVISRGAPLGPTFDVGCILMVRGTDLPLSSAVLPWLGARRRNYLKGY